MFKIDSSFQYINHLASTEEIAAAVKDDLASREHCKSPELVVVEDHKDEPASWDPGGALIINDKTFTFKLENVTIEIKRQHFGRFVDWVQYAKLRKWYDTKYYKIHSGYANCLCITENEFEQLKCQLNNPKLALEAATFNQERQMAIEGSFIQTVRAKDKNGNPVIIKTKKREPILN